MLTGESGELELLEPNPGRLPLPVSHTRTTGAACRDLLDQIRSLTFTSYNAGSLPKLQIQLEEILTELRLSAQKENNLMMEGNQDCEKKQKKQKKRKSDCSEKVVAKLPKLPKRPKNNRVGVKAEQQRLQRESFFNIDTGKLGKPFP